MIARSILHDEFIARMRLIRSENVGGQTFKNLLSAFGSAQDALDKIPELAANGGLKRNINIAAESKISNELELLENFGAKILFWDDEIFSPALKITNDCPPVLTVKGRIELMHSSKNVAIVGSRNASINGCAISKKIASELSERGVVITSGLARGIDASAHEGALRHGTIGVIAGGIDVVYPAQNQKLYDTMYDDGLIVSEYPFGAEPIARHFPQRNRIISGLCNVLLVVEASKKSGSLITAECAEKHKRLVFAIPGSPLDTKYSGCNWLIKSGKAELFEGYEDIMQTLKNEPSHMSEGNQNNITGDISGPIPSNADLSEYRNTLYNSLSYSPTAIEEIIINLKIPYNVLNILLLELELSGKISRSYGNVITKTPDI